MPSARRQVEARVLLVTTGAVEPAEVRALARAIEQQAAGDPRRLRVRTHALSALPQQAPATDTGLPLAAVIVWIGANAQGGETARRRFLEQTADQCRRESIVFLSIIDEAAPGMLRAFAREHGLLAQRLDGGLDPHACAYAVRIALTEAARRTHAARAAAPDAAAGSARNGHHASEARAAKAGSEPGGAAADGFTRSKPPTVASAPPEPPAPPAVPPAAATRGLETSTVPPIEPVRIGASAPRAVRPGDEFTARFVAYLPRDEVELGALLSRLAPRNEHVLNAGECQWKVGTRVSVRLSGRHLQVSPAEQSFDWNGKRSLLDFDVTVEPDAPATTVVLKFDALVDGIVIARVRLDLGIRPDGQDLQAHSATVDSARTAFASYSSQDRERVVDRLAAVRIATGMDVFLDCMALHPGEQWKPRLAAEIRDNDLFLLFWSAASAASPWVEWEWRTALAEKGRDAMQIHPLESRVKPPDELKDLHFGDVFMLVREATVAQRAAPR